MATSGSTSLDLSVADLLENAYEIAGINAQELNFGHMARARQIATAVLAEWSSSHIALWKVTERIIPTVSGDADYVLPSEVIDVLDVVYRPSGSGDVPMQRLTRAAFLEIPNKSDQGQPDRFWVDRQLAAPIFNVWQVPDNTVDNFVMYTFDRYEDILSGQENAEISIRFWMAFWKRLGYELMPHVTPRELRDESYQNDRQVARGEYKEAFNIAASEDRDRGPTGIYPQGFVPIS